MGCQLEVTAVFSLTK